MKGPLRGNLISGIQPQISKLNSKFWSRRKSETFRPDSKAGDRIL
jgi:hypothetical protein